ncbi:MAG: hypothetical protein GXP54_01320 [Deltaproteobacteria bacterium]|nr:hypothetical protein [Deltaproteobacteria bacterium]
MRDTVGTWAGIGAFLGGLALFAFVGMASDPGSPRIRSWAATIPKAEFVRLDPARKDLVKQMRLESRIYESAYYDIVGSSFTPQDVSWSESGYPDTNPWCLVPGALKGARAAGKE